MKNSYSRRDALRLGLSGMAAAGVGSFLQLGNALPAAAGSSDPKMLLIFLRGGNDGLNTVLPAGDPTYAQKRGALNLLNHGALPLTSYASLHPAMTDLHALHTTGAANIAFLHRIHYPNASLSHFASQQIWETAAPIDEVCGPGSPAGCVPEKLIEEGFVPRLLQIAAPAVDFKGASCSPALQRLFRTADPDRVLPHVASLDDAIADPKLKSFLEQDYDAALAQNAVAFDPLVRSHGRAMIVAQDATNGLSDLTTGNYPGGSGFLNLFSGYLRDAVNILLQTDCRVVGVELGGFDTHIGQESFDSTGALDPTGSHATLMRGLSEALAAIHTDTSSLNLLTFVMSEFGRTTAANVNLGTDHGQASVALAMGPGVNPGVYNCDATSWNTAVTTSAIAQNPISPMTGKYLKYRTDFRAVYEEILERHFNITGSGDINTIIPQLHQAGGPFQATDPTLTQLGFLA